MTAPSVVQIGPVAYQVSYNPKFAADNLVGQIRYYESTIELQPNMAPAMETIGLWHEILHGVMLQGGYREHDEQLLDVLAHGIVSVLLNNPEVVKLTTEGE